MAIFYIHTNCNYLNLKNLSQLNIFYYCYFVFQHNMTFLSSIVTKSQDVWRLKLASEYLNANSQWRWFNGLIPGFKTLVLLQGYKWLQGHEICFSDMIWKYSNDSLIHSLKLPIYINI